jgi:hypothetical protein
MIRFNPAKPEIKETIIVGFAGYKCALGSKLSERQQIVVPKAKSAEIFETQ